MPQKRPTPTCGDPGHAANSRTLGKAGFGELGDRRLPSAAHLSARLSRGCTHLQEAASQAAGRSHRPLLGLALSLWLTSWPAQPGGSRRQAAGRSAPRLFLPRAPHPLTAARLPWAGEAPGQDQQPKHPRTSDDPDRDGAACNSARQQRKRYNLRKCLLSEFDYFMVF